MKRFLNLTNYYYYYFLEYFSSSSRYHFFVLFFKISWMKCKNPTDSNKAAITSCLKETLPNRRNWITEKRPTISEIFEKYPRLSDYKGEMVRNISNANYDNYVNIWVCLTVDHWLKIDMEFENMFEGATNNFLAKFPSYYTPRILAYSSFHRPDLYKLTSNIDNGMRKIY